MSQFQTAFNCNFKVDEDVRLRCGIWWVKLNSPATFSGIVLSCKVIDESSLLKQNCISYSFFTMLNPVSLSCGHSGCKDCILELVKIQGPRSPLPGMQSIFWWKISETKHYLEINHLALPVKCCNRDCGWEGVYQNAAAHYGQCRKLDIECPNGGCFRTDVRESMDAHAAVCPKRKVPCPECKRPVVWETLPDHQTEDCPNAIMECPLSCGESFPRYVDYKTTYLKTDGEAPQDSDHLSKRSTLQSD